MSAQRDQERQLDLATTLIVLRRRGWMILVAVIAALATAAAITRVMPERFEATAILFVGGNSSSGEAAIDLQYAALSKTLVVSYAGLATTNVVGADAARRADIPQSEFEGAIRTDFQQNDQILKVSVVADSAALASRMTNALAEALVDRVDRLNTNDGGTVALQVIDRAIPPLGPVSPKPALNMIFGGLIGLLLGCGVAFAVDRLDRRIRSQSDAERELGLPVLGAIPTWPRRVVRGEALARHAHQDVAEPFRSLAVTVGKLLEEKGASKLLITSARAGDGKTTAASHLAIALAEDGHRTALVEGDLRRPMLQRHFPPIDGYPVAPKALNGNSNGAGALSHISSAFMTQGGVQNLLILAADDQEQDAGQALRTPAFAETLAAVMTKHDICLVDAPPALIVSDASLLARHVDGVLLIVRAGVTRADELRRVVAGFKRLNTEVLGLILVGARLPKHRYYYSGSGMGTRTTPVRPTTRTIVPAKPLEEVRSHGTHDR